MPASGQGRNAVDALMAGLEANRAHPIMIHRLDAPIIVDGQVVDAVWDKIEPLPNGTAHADLPGSAHGTHRGPDRAR